MVHELSSTDSMDTLDHRQSRRRGLGSFPYLSDSEFDEACSALLERFQRQGHLQNEWTAVDNVSQNETNFLRISKPLALHPSFRHASIEAEDAEIEEEDDEVAERATDSRAVIHYDAILSPSYRVPVLYFAISDSQHRYPLTTGTLYTHIVPQAFKAQAEYGSIIGGITITDHPTTNKPVFFIHPCRTAEVLEASVSNNRITTYDYLLVWLGALGKSAGLNVPLSLAQTLE